MVLYRHASFFESLGDIKIFGQREQHCEAGEFFGDFLANGAENMICIRYGDVRIFPCFDIDIKFYQE